MTKIRDGLNTQGLTTNLERRENGALRWAVNLPVLTSALIKVEENPLGGGERFTRPVLVVRGGKARYVTNEDAARITEHFPAARVETIAAAGHDPHMAMRVHAHGANRAGGQSAQAMARSRSSLAATIRLACDALGYPLGFTLTGANVSDFDGSSTVSVGSILANMIPPLKRGSIRGFLKPQKRIFTTDKTRMSTDNITLNAWALSVLIRSC